MGESLLIPPSSPSSLQDVGADDGDDNDVIMIDSILETERLCTCGCTVVLSQNTELFLFE
jgi:hypothetical protein